MLILLFLFDDAKVLLFLYYVATWKKLLVNISPFTIQLHYFVFPINIFIRF